MVLKMLFFQFDTLQQNKAYTNLHGDVSNDAIRFDFFQIQSMDGEIKTRLTEMHRINDEIMDRKR